ncbi:hypothetical protein [Thalassobius sp. MITS945101]|uniref:hypothetical protein n=1 Tax=Thalassobius sp. MITS945101 TaxID=3096994 RepID=UPI00399A1AE6
MALTNRILMGCASLSMAFGIGFVMQNGAEVPGQSKPQQLAAAAPSDRIELSGITLTVGTSGTATDLPVNDTSADAAPVLPAEEPVTRVAAAPQLEAPSDLDLPVLEVPSRQCDPSLSLTAQTGAMVLMTVDAPCLPDQRVTFHHNGLMFTHMTDTDGQLAVSAPALATSAVFIADFGNGDGAVGHVMVPDLDQYERAAAQWRGDLGIELHAREFGADYGQAGHVWNGALQATQAGAALTLLGDRALPESYRAEVYTVPAAVSEGGDIQLSIEAEVTAMNCNQDIQAEAIQWHPSGSLDVRELSLSVPGCDTVGDFLLLKNLLQDLKIAAK